MSFDRALNAFGRLSLGFVHLFKTGGVIVNEHVLSLEQTRRHVEVLGRWFDFIHLSELQDRIGAARSKKPFCLLTFDDGKRSNATVVAPELKRLGVPAAFFLVTGSLDGHTPFWFDRYWALRAKLGTVPAGFELHALKQLPYGELTARIELACARYGVEADLSNDDIRPMSWDEARRLHQQGFSVGAHGHTHAILTRETRDAAFRNIAKGIAMVRAEIGAPRPAFAFPNGNYTPELALHAIRSGAGVVLTTEPVWVDETFPLWRLPRVQLFCAHSAGVIELKLALAASGWMLSNPDGTGRIYRSMRGFRNGPYRNSERVYTPVLAEPPSPLRQERSMSSNSLSRRLLRHLKSIAPTDRPAAQPKRVLRPVMMNGLSHQERAVISAHSGDFRAVRDPVQHLGGSLSSALVVALFGPLSLLKSRAVQRILLATVLLDLPFQFGTHLFYSDRDAAFGALGGLSISATTIALLALYLSWFFLSFASRSRKPGPPLHFNLPLVLFLAFSAISVFVASDVSLALYELFLAAQLYLVYFYVANNLGPRDDILFVVSVLLVGCLIESAAMIALEFTGMPSTLWGLPTHLHMQSGIHEAFTRVGGTIGSPNEAGAYLSLLLPLAACFLFADSKRWQKSLACLVLGLGGVAMIFTYSRGGWIALVLSAIILGFVLMRTCGVSLKTPIGILTLLILLYLSFHSVISARVFGDDQGSAESRIPLTMLALRMIAHHPVFGVGANNFSVVMMRYLTSYFRTGFLYVVHNKYLLIWTETGIGGLLAYLAFLFGVLRTGWRCWKQNEGYLSILALGITAAIVGDMVHMNFDVFQIGPVQELLWLLAGLLIPMYRIGAPVPARGMPAHRVSRFEGYNAEAMLR